MLTWRLLQGEDSGEGVQKADVVQALQTTLDNLQVREPQHLGCSRWPEPCMQLEQALGGCIRARLAAEHGSAAASHAAGLRASP